MSTQLTFTLSTSDKVRSVHLLGSWDNYKQQVPLSESRAGKWKGTFKFPSTMVKGGSRYWYYYHIDGFKPTHDPNEKYSTEPTTGRKLNILDVPKGASTSTTSRPSSNKTSSRQSVEIPKGRGISPSKIVHPKPSKPYESRHVREADYSASPVGDLCDKLEKTSLYKMGTISPPSSVGSSLSSRSSGASSPDSLSSLSEPSSSSSGSCRCNKYGITRKGDRVKLDCGGRLCGYSDDSDSCSSIESVSESEEEEVRPSRSVGKSSSSKPKYVEVEPKRSQGRGGGRSLKR